MGLLDSLKKLFGGSVTTSSGTQETPVADQDQEEASTEEAPANDADADRQEK